MSFKGRQDNGDFFKEKVVRINRVCKVVKGGKRFSFNALLVVGNEKGRVGYGLGKANDVAEAIQKGIARAKKNLINVPLKEATIAYEVKGHAAATTVILRPALLGRGIVAAGGARAILECAGIRDIVTKTLGSHNPFNVINATLDGLEQLSQIESIKALRKRQ